MEGFWLSSVWWAGSPFIPVWQQSGRSILPKKKKIGKEQGQIATCEDRLELVFLLSPHSSVAGGLQKLVSFRQREAEGAIGLAAHTKVSRLVTECVSCRGTWYPTPSEFIRLLLCFHLQILM